MLRELGPEIFAFLTLGMLNPGDEFHGSYQPPKFTGAIKHRRELFSRAAGTGHRYSVRQFDRAFGESFSELTNAPPVDVWKHLDDALARDNCSSVYLFLCGLRPESKARLAEKVGRNPRVEFVLVSADEDLPAGKNVSLFNLRRGWLQTTQATATRDWQVLLPDGAFDEVTGVVGLEGDGFTQFWARLPNIGSGLPSLRQHGQVRLRDLRLKNADAQRGKWQVEWLSGRFTGAGSVALEFNTIGGADDFFSFRDQSLPAQTLKAEVNFPAGKRGNRFVATFYGRQLADALDAKIACLRRDRRAQSRKDLFTARREIARLSKRFGFISSETAFIALPPDLMAKYGFTPQQYAADQIYDPAKSASIIPEPETWTLVALGLSIFGYMAWRRKMK